MYLCYVSKLFILFLMCQNFLLYFTTVRIFMYPCFYSISPYCYVYVSKLLALFHYTDMLCIQAFYPVSYVSGLFTLFHHIFYVCLCVQAFYSVSYVSELFTLFHHTLLYVMCPSFLSCFLCVRTFYSISPYYYVFMYPCFCTISPYILIIYVMYPNYSHYFTT